MTTKPDDHIHQAARMLRDAEVAATAVGAVVPAPTDLVAAYRVQQVGHRLHGERLVAWKAGVTSEAGLAFLELSEPVTGRVRASHVLESPASIDTADFATAPQLEVEVGFRLLEDHSGLPSDSGDLADIVEAVAVIEVVSGRVDTFPLIDAKQLVADNVVAGRIIVGPSLGLDARGVRALDTVALSLEIDGDTVAEGTGAAALGHPLNILRWLAEHALDAGAPLRAGELVITGTCTGMTPVRPGSRHVARVGDAAVELDAR